MDTPHILGGHRLTHLLKTPHIDIGFLFLQQLCMISLYKKLSLQQDEEHELEILD